jgi:hypothetical protein
MRLKGAKRSGRLVIVVRFMNIVSVKNAVTVYLLSGKALLEAKAATGEKVDGESFLSNRTPMPFWDLGRKV